jgi:heme-degrading monooxygenase HmoA
MVHVLVEVTVEDFDVFFSGFESRGFPLRRRHGSRRSQIFRHADDPSKVSILFEWESREGMEGFLGDPEVRESMKKGGTLGPPKITYLDRAGELEA